MFVFFVCFFLLHYTFLQLEKQNNKVVHTIYYFLILRGSIGKPGDSMAQMMKNLPAMRGTRVRCLGQEDPLEKGMTTQYSCLGNSMDRGAWQATYSPCGRKELDMTE